jgi:hypothetical protein
MMCLYYMKYLILRVFDGIYRCAMGNLATLFKSIWNTWFTVNLRNLRNVYYNNSLLVVWIYGNQTISNRNLKLLNATELILNNNLCIIHRLLGIPIVYAENEMQLCRFERRVSLVYNICTIIVYYNTWYYVIPWSFIGRPSLLVYKWESYIAESR